MYVLWTHEYRQDPEKVAFTEKDMGKEYKFF